MSSVEMEIDMREFLDDFDWEWLVGLALKIKGLSILLSKDIPAISRRIFRKRPRPIVVKVQPVMLSGLPAHLAAASGTNKPVWFQGIDSRE